MGCGVGQDVARGKRRGLVALRSVWVWVCVCVSCSFVVGESEVWIKQVWFLGEKQASQNKIGKYNSTINLTVELIFDFNANDWLV